MFSRVINSVTVGLLLCPLVSFAQETPKRYAVLVGAKEYDHKNLDPLKFSENDATELSKLLKEGGYSITLLTDTEGKKSPDRVPTKANIESAIRDVLKLCKKNDLFLVAFAGHGVQFDGNPDCYFCPKDAKPFSEEVKTLVSFNELYQQFEKSNPITKVILADCCRNDPGGSRAAKRNARNSLTSKPSPEGVFTCFSCSNGEFAFERADLGIGHGVFFFHLMEGLRKKGNSTSFPTLIEEVSSNVSEMVKEKQGRGADQRPNLRLPLDYRPGDKLFLLDRGVVTRPTPMVSANPTPMTPEPMTPKNVPSESLKLDATQAVSAKKVAEIRDQIARGFGLTPTLSVTASGKKIDFVLIPPGIFDMGTRRVVLTKPYYMSVTEITQKQYLAFSGAALNPSYFQVIAGKTPPELVGIKDTSDFPIERVSFEDATKVATKLFTSCKTALPGRSITVRLPTEAEWEFACRAGSTSPFPEEKERLTTEEGNFVEGKLLRPVPVGSFPANAFGLKDMHGNVAEWCEDAFLPSLGEREEKDPLKKAESFVSQPKRVVRGGSWKDSVSECGSMFRGTGEIGDQKTNKIGFRVVIVIDPGK